MPGTDELVGGLVRGLDPVRPIPQLRTVAAAALALGAVAAAVVLGIRGVRPDIVAGTIRPSVVSIAIGLVVTALGGIAVSLGSAVPGRERVARFGVVGLLGGLALSAGAAGWGLFSMGAAVWEGFGFECLSIAFLAGLLPGVALLIFLIRAFPTRPNAALACACGGAVALGAFSAHASCPATGGLHVLLGHALAPLFGGAVLSLVLYPVLQRLRR